MQENINEEEILMSCFGRDNFGASNASTQATLLLYKGGDSNEDKTNEFNYEEVATRFIENAEFYLESHNGIVQVDFKFISNLDPEMNLLWRMFTDFGKELNKSLLKETSTIPLLSILVSPTNDAKHFLTLSNPMLWFLQPESPEESKCNIIRAFYDASDIEIKTVSEDIDEDKIKAEAMRTYDVVYKEIPRY